MKTVYRTIKSATYTPAAERDDEDDRTIGDVTYVRFIECDHLMLGSPIHTYRVGDSQTCWACTREKV